MTAGAPRRRPDLADGSDERSRIYARSSVIFAGSMILVALAFVVTCSYALVSCDDALRTTRSHLASVRIDPRSCPSIVAVHKAANEFHLVEPSLLDVITVNTSGQAEVGAWVTRKAHIAGSLDDLERAIVAAAPQLPTQMQQYLRVVLAAIRHGRAQLYLATGAGDLYLRVSSSLEAGHTALGYASDLVGRRCGVPLAADD